MKTMKNQKSQGSRKQEKKEKLQNFGLNTTKENNERRFFSRKEGNQFIVYDILSSEIFFINKIGKEILDLVERGLLKEEIIETISKKYNISKRVVRKDVREFMEDFKWE